MGTLGRRMGRRRLLLIGATAFRAASVLAAFAASAATLIANCSVLGPVGAPDLCIMAGVAVGAVFIRRQRNLVDPLIDLRLFRAPAFRAALATYLLATFAVFGPYVFIAQYLQLVRGLSPMQAGLWS